MEAQEQTTLVETRKESVEPIKTRIKNLLDGMHQTPGWLAERAKVERSTVKRIIDGDRYPTADTLALLAPILGVTIEELVHGTDAADRIETSRKLIDRTHYEEAVKQFIAMEQRATDLSRRLREAEESVANEHKKWSKTEKALESIKVELEETRQEARDHHEDAQRYKAALEQALTDLANLKTNAEDLRLEVEKLGGQMGSNKVLTGIATFCAATAAALSLNSYLKDEPKTPNTSNSRKKKKRTTSI